MLDDKKTVEPEHMRSTDVGDVSDGISAVARQDGLHRRLNNRQIQLIAAGGAIGTALFVSIGGGLAKGGPASLFIAFTIYSCVLALVNNSLAEMSTHMPVAGGFVRIAGKWVDDALGFMVGWNFFFFEALSIPFEITALTLVLSFWSKDVMEPGATAGIAAAVIVIYGALNILAVRAYGEAEFWLSGGKLILIFILFAFTFITMVGGNPQHDAYGFRYWANPGAFAKFRSTSESLGKFEGFLAALWTAAFTIVGPEYMSMVSAEAQHPSVYIKSAFITVYWRFCIFFILGALAVAIVIPYNDPTLVDIYFGSGGGSGIAAASPYVIAMENLGIKVLPDIVNALLLTSIFSAGNTYTYVSTRTLHGLALDGRAPRLLTYVNSEGVPVYAFCVVMLFSFLSFLQVSSSSATVLNWMVTLITGAALINYIVMGVTFLNYYYACKAQGVDRKTRPYYGRFQPYGAWFALIFQVLILVFYGYSSFDPWNVANFFTNYTMQLVAPSLFIGWKLIKKTRWVRPREVDLVWERPIVDAYEASITTSPVGFWTELAQMIGLCKNAGQVVV